MNKIVLQCLTENSTTLKSGTEMLKSSIKEKSQNIDSTQETTIRSTNWKSFVENLLAVHEGKLTVTVDHDKG